MMRVLWGLMPILLISMTGCSSTGSIVDEAIHDSEQVLRKKNRCEVESTDFRPDAATKSYYRCTGGNCKDHGCYAH